MWPSMCQIVDIKAEFEMFLQVTESADFQKDLSLDSLDRVELVMAFEQEFSIEIPDEEADKLKCCADVAQYIISGAEKKAQECSQSNILVIPRRGHVIGIDRL